MGCLAYLCSRFKMLKTEIMKNNNIFLSTLLLACLSTGSVYAQEKESDDFEKFRIGGYGEVTANFKDYGLNRYYGGLEGTPKQNHNTISIPRFVLAGLH